MGKILKGKLDQTQNVNATLIVTNTRILIIKTVKEFGLPVSSFKKTKENAHQNSQILATFKGKLGVVM